MSKKVILCNVRLSYEHIFTPTRFDESQEPKYSATFIIPADHPDLTKVALAMMEAGQEMFPNDFKGSDWPRGYTRSLKDADTERNSLGEILSEKNSAYKGAYILEANSSSRPITLDRKKRQVTEDDGVIYSGCYVNASLVVSGYTYGKIKKGVKCYLNGIQFVKDGERFGANAFNDFDELDGEDDDFMV